jgi:hypothetical protein
MTDKKQDLITIGGDLESALQKGFQLDLKTLLREAWRLTFGAKVGLLLAAATVLALMFLLIRLMAYSGWLETESAVVSMLFSIILAAVLSPVSSSLDMLGLRRALGSQVRGSMVFDYLRQAPTLIQTSLLFSGFKGGLESLAMHSRMAETLSMVLLLLFSVSMMFTIPLVLERGLSPARAMWTSFRLFLRGWPQLLLLYAVLAALFVLAMLPLGLGLIWMVPFYLIVNGIVYRDVCGVRVRIEITPKDAASLDKGSFVA